MKPLLISAVSLALPLAAFAQRPPLQDQAPASLLPPSLQSLRGDPAPSPAPKPSWIAAGSAKLQALDKVNAASAMLTVKVGQTATFGSLTIAVKSCYVHPSDQPADAAAFVAVTDSHPDSDPFNGWLLANEPSVSMMQHPVYDIRVAGCS